MSTHTAPLEVSHASISAEPLPQTLAVMVLRDGRTLLEQRNANDLADVDLTFSLDPVFAQCQ